MKCPLAVGDRVAVYVGHPSQAWPQRYTAKICYEFLPEEQYPPNVADLENGDRCFQLTDKSSEHCPSYVHPKQCRRLVKKSRRRVWVGLDEFCSNQYPRVYKQRPHDSDVDYQEVLEFVEVRPKAGPEGVRKKS